jgi:phosphotransferase system enzyme I (PtsP)
MLDSLRRIVHEVNSAYTLDEVLTLIVERVKAALQADVCSVYLNDPETGEHVLMATDGLRPGAVGQVRLASGRGMTGLAASRAEPVNVHDAPSHPHFEFVAATGESPYHGFLGLPIIRRGKPLGVLVVQQRQNRKFTAEEESFLATLAAQLAGSITQAEIRQSLDRLDTGLSKKTVFLEGVASARGLGIGEAVVVFPETDLSAVPDKAISDTAADEANFSHAVATEMDELKRLSKQLEGILAAGDRALFDAYALLLSSDSLVQGTLRRIREGNWAPGALRATVFEYANIFEEMDDPYLAGRAADIRDLGRRLLKRLQQERPEIRQYPERTILMGKEIGVSDFLDVPAEKLAGIVSVRGTSASHVALLARGLSIPAVFGIRDTPLERINGRQIVVDGYLARVCIQPSPALLDEYHNLATEEAQLSQELESLRDEPAITPDGRRFTLLANSGLFADIAAARERGAEGVGLYRSELHFYLRDNFPGEDEQTQTYTRVMQTMAPYPVTLRTLDVGGDKPLPYFPISEENPFLGWRGIRISLDQPDIFKTQVRAMLRASAQYPNMGIMFPMVSCVSELREARTILQQAYEELLEDDIQVSLPRVGVMLEVPSAAYLAGSLARLVDFVSIGSNDLTQYILAVDRNNERVAKLYDSLHPAVLYTLQHIVRQSHDAARPVSVCGEMAGDPAGAILLMGMGVDSLSMSVSNLPKIKWVIRSITHKEAKAVLKEALRMENAEAIRGHVYELLEQRGLGNLVRGGR